MGSGVSAGFAAPDGQRVPRRRASLGDAPRKRGSVEVVSPAEEKELLLEASHLMEGDILRLCTFMSARGFDLYTKSGVLHFLKEALGGADLVSLCERVLFSTTGSDSNTKGGSWNGHRSSSDKNQHGERRKSHGGARDGSGSSGAPNGPSNGNGNGGGNVSGGAPASRRSSGSITRNEEDELDGRLIATGLWNFLSMDHDRLAGFLYGLYEPADGAGLWNEDIASLVRDVHGPDDERRGSSGGPGGGGGGGNRRISEDRRGSSGRGVGEGRPNGGSFGNHSHGADGPRRGSGGSAAAAVTLMTTPSTRASDAPSLTSTGESVIPTGISAGGGPSTSSNGTRGGSALPRALRRKLEDAAAAAPGGRLRWEDAEPLLAGDGGVMLAPLFVGQRRLRERVLGDEFWMRREEVRAEVLGGAVFPNQQLSEIGSDGLGALRASVPTSSGGSESGGVHTDGGAEAAAAPPRRRRSSVVVVSSSSPRPNGLRSPPSPGAAGGRRSSHNGVGTVSGIGDGGGRGGGNTDARDSQGGASSGDEGSEDRERSFSAPSPGAAGRLNDTNGSGCAGFNKTHPRSSRGNRRSTNTDHHRKSIVFAPAPPASENVGPQTLRLGIGSNNGNGSSGKGSPGSPGAGGNSVCDSGGPGGNSSGVVTGNGVMRTLPHQGTNPGSLRTVRIGSAENAVANAAAGGNGGGGGGSGANFGVTGGKPAMLAVTKGTGSLRGWGSGKLRMLTAGSNRNLLSPHPDTAECK